MSAIQLSSVTKRFGDIEAVRDLDLTVESGEIYGFLGPNGAGKSTTINMLLDFVRPTEGTITVLGEPVEAAGAELRERIGVLPEGFDVYSRLTGRKHIEFAIDSKEADDDPAEILDRVGLSEAADRPAGGYSKGMRQRLALGMALVGEPELLILDEPSTGLDPGGAREMREIVEAEAARGATVFFSSHVLGQVEAVCDRVGILHEGELVTEDSIEGLREASDSEATLILTVDDATDDDLDAVRRLDGVSGAAVDGSMVTVSCEAGVKTDVISTLGEAGIEIQDIETESTSLEELFLSYTDGEGVVEKEGTGTGEPAVATPEGGQ
ncbi:ABC transporter ATP-binding protein [Halohasta litorea]|uniref:ABC transporter ATP-binding protein n=1 Tax=Halohasta litorea TaxID=869891 RepID=A0ABD6D2M7_9EURY|nr:ABC transporter ATP-binding protein [Halohasta litorea]